MKSPPKLIEVKVERTIPASLDEVFDAWLDPGVPGTTWHESDKLIFNPEVDGFFYWLIRENPHYGRFTEITKPSRIQYTWMSPSTLGMESIVTVNFKEVKNATLMTLLHSHLPDTDGGRKHEQGWNYFLDKLVSHFENRLRK